MLEIRPSAAFEAGQVDGSSVSKLSPILMDVSHISSRIQAYPQSKINDQTLGVIPKSVYLLKKNFSWKLWIYQFCPGYVASVASSGLLSKLLACQLKEKGQEFLNITGRIFPEVCSHIFVSLIEM